jgi:hypothetical protein
MADHPISDDSDATSRNGPDVDQQLTAAVTAHAHEPDECTIFPLDADEETITTTWISARGDAFVPLAEMR